MRIIPAPTSQSTEVCDNSMSCADHTPPAQSLTLASTTSTRECLLLLLLLLLSYPSSKNHPHLFSVPSCLSFPSPWLPSFHILNQVDENLSAIYSQKYIDTLQSLPYSSFSNKWALKQIDPRCHDSCIKTQDLGTGEGMEALLGCWQSTEDSKICKSKGAAQEAGLHVRLLSFLLCYCSDDDRLSSFIRNLMLLLKKREREIHSSLKMWAQSGLLGKAALLTSATSTKGLFIHCLFVLFGSPAHDLYSIHVLQGTTSATLSAFLLHLQQLGSMAASFFLAFISVSLHFCLQQWSINYTLQLCDYTYFH